MKTSCYSTTQRGRDWRALGGFSALIVALFTEMDGSLTALRAQAPTRSFYLALAGVVYATCA